MGNAIRAWKIVAVRAMDWPRERGSGEDGEDGGAEDGSGGSALSMVMGEMVVREK